MTINTTQLRSFIGPVWQEISSLWSGVDFSIYDPTQDSEEPEQALRIPESIRAATNNDAEVRVRTVARC